MESRRGVQLWPVLLLLWVVSLPFSEAQHWNTSIIANQSDPTSKGLGEPLVQLLPDPAFWGSGWTIGSNDKLEVKFFSPAQASGSCNLLRALFNGTNVEIFSQPSAYLNVSTLNATLDGIVVPLSTTISANMTFSPLFSSTLPLAPIQHMFVLSTTNCAAAMKNVNFAYANFTAVNATSLSALSLPAQPNGTIDGSQYSKNSPTTFVKNSSVTFYPKASLLKVNSSDYQELATESLNSSISLSIHFYGSGIEAFSVTEAESDAEVVIDGRPLPSISIDTSTTFTPGPYLLANITGLWPGWHALDIRVTTTTLNDELAMQSFAYANIIGFEANATQQQIASNSGNPAQPSTRPSSHSHSVDLEGVIAGVVLGTALLAAPIAVFFYLRKRRINRRRYTPARRTSEDSTDRGNRDQSQISLEPLLHNEPNYNRSSEPQVIPSSEGGHEEITSREDYANISSIRTRMVVMNAEPPTQSRTDSSTGSITDMDSNVATLNDGTATSTESYSHEPRRTKYVRPQVPARTHERPSSDPVHVPDIMAARATPTSAPNPAQQRLIDRLWSEVQVLRARHDIPNHDGTESEALPEYDSPSNGPPPGM